MFLFDTESRGKVVTSLRQLAPLPAVPTPASDPFQGWEYELSEHVYEAIPAEVQHVKKQAGHEPGYEVPVSQLQPHCGIPGHQPQRVISGHQQPKALGTSDIEYSYADPRQK